MRTLAPLLQTFFTDYLMQQRRASSHTIAAYRDAFRLLLGFMQQRHGKAPAELDLADWDAPLISAFLQYLEAERGNSIRTRNARLAAIHSFFRFAALRVPDLSALIQRVLAIPPKRYDRTTLTFLTPPEVQALLAAPDRQQGIGRRDHALLLLTVQTGLRLSELTQLRGQDLQLGAGAHVRCQGKGRKQRCIPLTQPTVAVLREWLRERGDPPEAPLFPSRRGGPLSRDAVQRLVDKYATQAQNRCPSLAGRRITPHGLRHTSAMQLLQAGVDQSVIALWLGHESTETTQIYLHADLSIKEQALARTAPPRTSVQRYKPPDRLLAFLKGL